MPTEYSESRRASLNALLYKAHVYMITHGAVLCGENPQCDGCPMRSCCEYGSLLRDDASAIGMRAQAPAPEATSDGDASIPALAAQAVSAGAAAMAPPAAAPAVHAEANSSKSDLVGAATSTEHSPNERGPNYKHETGGHYQLIQAREVLDQEIAPQHPGDHTPRLLVETRRGSQEEGGERSVHGRLLISPWSAFRGVFPMHGTYFFQNEVISTTHPCPYSPPPTHTHLPAHPSHPCNPPLSSFMPLHVTLTRIPLPPPEVFEDESAGQVEIPESKLGPPRPVYVGKSIEGVLRRRGVDELRRIFRGGFVCIRRFRSRDSRLLPLVLEPMRLLKYHAVPSEVALQLGLQQTDPSIQLTDSGLRSSLDSAPPIDKEAEARSLVPSHAAGAHASHAQNETLPPPADAERAHAAADEAVAVAEAAAARSVFDRALKRGLRLFSVYIAAGGGLCMRPVIWRKLMPLLHPDRGGDVQVFQRVNELKRFVDAGEELKLAPDEAHMISDGGGDEDTERLVTRLKDDMLVAAS